MGWPGWSDGPRGWLASSSSWPTSRRTSRRTGTCRRRRCRRTRCCRGRRWCWWPDGSWRPYGSWWSYGSWWPYRWARPWGATRFIRLSAGLPSIRISCSGVWAIRRAALWRSWAIWRRASKCDEPDPGGVLSASSAIPASDGRLFPFAIPVNRPGTCGAAKAQVAPRDDLDFGPISCEQPTIWCSLENVLDRPSKRSRNDYNSGIEGWPAPVDHDHRSKAVHETFAPIAQLDRASVYGTEGFWFESRWVYFECH